MFLQGNEYRGLFNNSTKDDLDQSKDCGDGKDKSEQVLETIGAVRDLIW